MTATSTWPCTSSSTPSPPTTPTRSPPATRRSSTKINPTGNASVCSTPKLRREVRGSRSKAWFDDRHIGGCQQLLDAEVNHRDTEGTELVRPSHEPSHFSFGR